MKKSQGKVHGSGKYVSKVSKEGRNLAFKVRIFQRESYRYTYVGSQKNGW